MKKKCPLFKTACIKHQCEFWHPVPMNVAHADGQVTVEIAEKCVFQWIPILLIENAKETRHAAASTDKVANEINAGAGTVLAKAMGLRLPVLEDKG